MNGFNELDLVNYRYLIFSNVIDATNQLIEGARKLRIIPEEETLVKIKFENLKILNGFSATHNVSQSLHHNKRKE